MDVSISCVHASKYGGCLAPLHTPAWREDEVIAAGLLAPGFQLSARAETAAVAEALARDQPHTLQPFLASCCTGALAAGVGIVRWWGKEQKPGEIVGRRDPNNVWGRSRSLAAD